MSSNLPWKPIRFGLDLDRQIDDAFRRIIGSPGLRDAAAWNPEFDLYETETCYLIEADVPGVTGDQLSIRVLQHSVTISGSRDSTGVERLAHGVRLERRHGSFSRTFQLDQAVNPATVRHVCDEGLHQIRIQKLKTFNDNSNA